MNSIPYLIIPFLFMLDVVLTYVFMKRCTFHFRNNEWINFEVNPIAKFFWKKYGLESGTIASAITISPLILFFTFMSRNNLFFFGIIIGVYMMVFMLHYKASLNLENLLDAKRKRATTS